MNLGDGNGPEKKYYTLTNLANTYKELERVVPPRNQSYSIYAYFLYSEPLDGVHGKQIFLGGYGSAEEAFSRATNLMKKTGHDCIYVCKTCSWEDIDEIKRPDRTITVDPKAKGSQLEKQFKEELKKRQEEKERQEQISQDIELQAERELDPTTIEHYAHNWYLAIKHKANYEYHKAEMEKYEKLFNQKSEKIKNQYKTQPELEGEWLSLYEERLKSRGEEDTFAFMKEGHKILKSQILNKN